MMNNDPSEPPNLEGTLLSSQVLGIPHAIAPTVNSDVLIGTPNSDRIIGDAGGDSIAGNQGQDTLNGNTDNDLIFGGQDSDLLHGGRGNDSLFGDQGNDILSGDLGADLLTGGAGEDRFILSRSFYPMQPSTTGGLQITEADWILDFADNQDKIQLEGGLTYNTLIISAGTGNFTGTTIIQDQLTREFLAILPGISRENLTTTDFITTVSQASSSSLLAASAPQTSFTQTPFNIEFDYRFDTNGFFNDPLRRQALELAASFWERHILDEFADLPPGSPIYIKHPTTGQTQSFHLDRPIDDIIVFVGANQLPNQTIAQAGPSGTWIPGTFLDMRFNGGNFEPWTGHITFNQSIPWFADSTPETSGDIPSSQLDLITVATHELGHILGIGNSKAFEQWISGQTFMGPNALGVTGGLGVPLADDFSHVQETFLPNGVATESLLHSRITSGVRQLPTILDLALLQDIGYQVLI